VVHPNSPTRAGRRSPAKARVRSQQIRDDRETTPGGPTPVGWCCMRASWTAGPQLVKPS
jgi:hypothetical protein